MSAPGKTQPSASELLMKKIAEMDEKQRESDKMVKIMNTEIIIKLDELLVKLSQLGTVRAKAAAKATTATSTIVGATIEKKPPSNSAYWFKALWKKDRDSTMNKYCTQEMVNSLKEHMENDSNAKTKEGAAILDEEVK